MVKKIHYCWFGGAKPDVVKRNVEEWAQLNPEFEICEWNEDNVDVSDYEFAQRAMHHKKWGFYADIVRLQKLVEEGGVYMDADVELVRPLAFLTEEDAWNKLQLGYMYDCALGTAVLYAPPAHPYLMDILHSYKYIREDCWPVNNSVFTAYFVNRVENFLLNGRAWSNSLCQLYPKEVFEQPSFIKSRGVSIHHCCGSWKQVFNRQFAFVPKNEFISHFLKWASRQCRTWVALQNNEFANCYKRAKKGNRVPFDISRFYTVDNPYLS